MTLANLAAHAPAWYDLLNQVGLQRRQTLAYRAAARAGWIGLGVLAGGGLAILLTPRSGPEMRERLGQQAQRARDYVTPNATPNDGETPLRHREFPAHT
jgi:hypothetical protein